MNDGGTKDFVLCVCGDSFACDAHEVDGKQSLGAGSKCGDGKLKRLSLLILVC